MRSSDLDGIDAATVQAWADLERRALEPNPYLSPLFVIPAIRHLREAARPVRLVRIERPDGERAELVGVGVFEVCGPTLRFPLRHLRSYRSRHSYLSGLLLDAQHADEAASALFAHLTRSREHGHGLEFSDLPADGALAKCLLQAAAEHGARWAEHDRQQRAILRPAQGGEAYLEQHLPAPRRSDLRRNLRRLAERGPVDWHALSGDALRPEHVERFIELEHRGWKAQSGSSLRSSPPDEAFFRAMIAGFVQAGRALLTELRLAGQPIASTANLLSPHAAFGFKLGWDPEYAKMAPGILNTVELTRRAPELLRGLDYMDSGAVQGSFMESLWSERRSLVSGMFVTSSLGQHASASVQLARSLRRRLLERAERLRTPPAGRKDADD